MSTIHRVKKLEDRLPGEPEVWLSITYDADATEAEIEALRLEAIKVYEAETGRALNREEINWTLVRICRTREQAARFKLGKYPSVEYS
jgi:siroheme synthase